MKADNTKDYMLKKVRKKNTPSIGIRERISLSLKARSDIRNHNLPTRDEHGNYVSTTIGLELESINELFYVSKVITDILNEKEKAKINKLLSEIPVRNTRLNQIKLSEPLPPTAEDLRQSYPGEEKLNETDIVARRLREYKKIVSKYEQRLSGAEAELQSAIDDIIILKATLQQQLEETVALVEAKWPHTSERIYYYWGKVFSESDGDNLCPFKPGASLPESIIAKVETIQATINEISKVINDNSYPFNNTMSEQEVA